MITGRRCVRGSSRSAASSSKPSTSGHHHVGEHEVGRALGELRERVVAVDGGAHGVLVLEQPREVHAQVGVVVDDEHLRPRPPPARRRTIARRRSSSAAASWPKPSRCAAAERRVGARRLGARAGLARPGARPGTCCPAPAALVDGDLAAVERDQLVDEREPDAAALVAAAARAAGRGGSARTAAAARPRGCRRRCRRPRCTACSPTRTRSVDRALERELVARSRAG